MERKHKHLEFIQITIIRMAANSFLIKGWMVTLVAALFAISSKDSNNNYIMLAFFPVPVLWLLDGYYLWQERLYRALYDKVRNIDESKIDYSMNTKQFVTGKRTWIRSIFSKTLNFFYGFLIVLMVLIVKFIL